MSIVYSNNKEYRKAIRDFFQMNQYSIYGQQICREQNVFDSDIDEETIDEFTYDTVAAEKKMNEIYEKTKSIMVFCKLYEIAAGLMFSEDLETGLAVLLSYDYFSYFYALYIIIDTCNDLESSIEYKELLKKISK